MDEDQSKAIQPSAASVSEGKSRRLPYRMMREMHPAER